jgi:hypothetical protein
MDKTNPGVIETVKDKSVAVVKGTGNVVGTAVDSTAEVLGTAVKDTAKVGGEVGTAATGLVTGAIKDVKKVGVGAEHATAAVAGGALKMVGEVGTETVDMFRKPATKPASSDKAEIKQHDKSVSQN